MKKIKLLIGGAGGRMGSRIIALAANDPAFEIAAVFESKDHPLVGEEIGVILGIRSLSLKVSGGLEAVIDQGDVVMDFTHPAAASGHVGIALRHRKGMVIGTTGLGPSTRTLIKKASLKIPLVQSPNMSAGMNLVFGLAYQAAGVLSEDYDVEIVEAHHRFKKDAPSGTALEIAHQVAKARGLRLEKIAVYGREGVIGERNRGSIGIHAIRGGDVVGEHTVSFLADGERIEITHRASSRDAFARGALRAARFVSKQKNGLFTMKDVLGMRG